MQPDGGDHTATADAPTEPLAVVSSRRAARASRRRQSRRRRRRLVVLLAVVVLLGVVGGGGYLLYSSVFGAPDFTGPGEGSVVAHVQDGDTTRQIAVALAEQGIVASSSAFTRAAADDDAVRSVQPGYYQMRLRMSGASAVAMLLAPASRVGQLEIRGGVQLDDTRTPAGTLVPGELSQISAATCLGEGPARRCVSAAELRTVMATTAPATLGVPEWALEQVQKADPKRRLEGLLQPGRYDVDPSMPALAVLQSLLATSSTRLEAAGIVSGAQAIGTSPYQVLVLASLVEKEGITADMPRVARVLYNRLGVGQRLQLDSTVNYPLDVQALHTSAANRTRPGAYNTYLNTGLPPTPIAAPGAAAITAALTPAPGPWLYFVRCQKNGASCFATTLPEHQANVLEAQKNGVI